MFKQNPTTNPIVPNKIARFERKGELSRQIYPNTQPTMGNRRQSMLIPIPNFSCGGFEGRGGFGCIGFEKLTPLVLKIRITSNQSSVYSLRPAK